MTVSLTLNETEVKQNSSVLLRV